MRFYSVLAPAYIGVAAAQNGAYGQCGGSGWAGATTCISGYSCQYFNEYYSQCVPGKSLMGLPRWPTASAQRSPSLLMYARNRKRIFDDHKRIVHEQPSDCHHHNIIGNSNHIFCICSRYRVQVVWVRRVSGRVRDRHSWRLGSRLLLPIDCDDRGE